MIGAGQLRAVSVLTWRGLTRRGFRGGKPQIGVGAALTRLMLFLLTMGYAAFSIWAMSWTIAGLKHGRTDATTLLVASLVFSFLSFVTALELTGGSLRYESRGTDRGALDALPLLLSTRIAVLAIHTSMVGVWMVVAFLRLAPQKLPAEWLNVSALAIALSLCSLFVSKAICVALRATVPSHFARRALRIIAGASGVAATWLLFSAILSIAKAETAGLVSFLRPIGKFLKAPPGAPSLRIWVWLLGMTAVSLLLIGILERRGYDRELAAPPGARKPMKGRMTAERAERVMSFGRRFASRLWLVQGLMLVGSVYLSARFLAPETVSSRVRDLAMRAPFLIVYFAWVQGSVLAMTQAKRDLQARPFLASLPITPAQTLASKTAALRLAILPCLTWLLPPLVALGGDHDFLWKTGVAAIALALSVDALVPVEFLGRGSVKIERILIAIPMFGALAAPTPLTELPSLGALALLAFEARRAAAQHLRWLDDADEELEHETPVWRALLVFGAFAGVQALVSLALVPFSGGLALGVGYLAAAAAVVLLTLSGRKGLPALRWIGAPAWLIPVGALAGGAAALLAGLYSKWIERFGVDPGPLSDALRDASSEVRLLLVVAVVVAAPLAEEMFFRGWLQAAMKVELPARWKRYAFVLAAFAFAAVHPGIAFPMVFLVGLIAGALYESTGGIAAGICAHAVYNAVVTLAH